MIKLLIVDDIPETRDHLSRLVGLDREIDVVGTAGSGEEAIQQAMDLRPDVIVIYDYGASTVAQKKKRLLDDPALKDVPAIKNKRFAVLPLSDVVLGVRAPGAVKKLAEQLR